MPRPRGSGKPKGYKAPTTLSKEAAREFLRQTVIANLQPMLHAQMANAQGLKYLVSRDPKTGKFERIGPAGVRPEATIEVWEKDPSVQAFADLLNRALDKPAEHVEMTLSKAQESTDEDLAERLATLSAKLRKA